MAPNLAYLLTNQAFSSPRQVYTVGNSGTSLLMWAATGNHGRGWTYADVILSNTVPFRVTFQAEVGGDMWTDIALDDIAYTEECVVEGEEVSFLGSLVRIQFSGPHPPGFTFSALFFFHVFCPPSAALQLCFHFNSAALSSS